MSKMLAHSGEPGELAWRNAYGDKVVFKNIEKYYKFPNTVTVEYILSPKVRTSSQDYIGLYPRDWKQLTDFAGFEYPIPAPFEEPNLYRCIQFICQRPHVTANLNQDYQFVYVNCYREVLGRSSFFQFVEEFAEQRVKEKLECPESNFLTEILMKSNMQLTPNEIAYNECFFRRNNPYNEDVNMHPEPCNLRAGGLDEASNNYAMQHEAPNTGFVFDLPVESLYQEAPRPGPTRSKRSIVKTHRMETNPNGLLQYQQQSCKPPPFVMRRGDGDVHGGAIPKQCNKCGAPSDFDSKFRLQQHQMKQAWQQIRDLNAEMDLLRNELQLTQAAHAKLRAAAEMAKLTGDRNILPFNNLMSSLTSHLNPNTVNCSGPPEPVIREHESPLLLVSQGNVIPFSYIRPLSSIRAPNEGRRRNLGGREYELKAMLKCQERTIQALQAKLQEAGKLLMDVIKSGHSISKPALSDFCTSNPSDNQTEEEEGSVPKSDSFKDRSHSNDGKTKVSNTEDGSVTYPEACVASADFKPNCGNTLLEMGVSPERSISDQTSESLCEMLEKTLVVEPKYFNLDPVNSMDCKVVVASDEAKEKKEICHKEANNNNYDIKDMNCDKKDVLNKCPTCKPTLAEANPATSEDP